MTIIFSENFTSDATSWSLASTVERRSGDSSVTGYETTGTGGFRDTDGFALVLRGHDAAAGYTRHATTPTISAITGPGTLSFDLIQGDDDNGGEDPDFDEGLYLEYSIDGGATWEIYVHYLTDYDFYISTTPDVVSPSGATPSGPYWGAYQGALYSPSVEWKTFSVPIPDAVIGQSDVQFRWRQKDYSTSQQYWDVWGLDNILITLVNNAPDLSTPTAGSISETTGSSDTTVSGLSGFLSATDADGDTLTYGIAGGTVVGDESILSGTYGTLSVNTTTGEYIYTPSAADIDELCAGSFEDSFTVSVSDGSETATSTYTVNITTLDNPAVITGDLTGSITENSVAGTITGTIDITDECAVQQPRFSDVSSTTTTNGYGSFSVSSSNQSSEGTWSYSLDSANEAVDALCTGDTLTDSFTLTATDGSTQAINITINGPDEVTGIDVHRFFSKSSGVHFYTASAEEKDNIITNLGSEFGYEGIAYKAPSSGGAVVSRFFNSDTNSHFWTASEEEKDELIGNPERGFEYEGSAYYVSKQPQCDQQTAVHRFYHPQSEVHFYTANESEANNVISNSLGANYDLENAYLVDPSSTGWGYKYEGVAWYVL